MYSNDNMYEKAIKIIKTLYAKGYQAVFAGGCVRDILLCEPYKDIDIATNASPDEIEGMFEHTLAVGKSFGVIVVVDGEDQFEVATFRTDGKYKNGRRPESVSYCSMKEDAKRRDLTINGMFYDPLSDILYDFVEGKNDLDKGIIRFIGDPDKRIEEDKLRMMRVIRFSVRFDFTIDQATLAAVERHAHDISKNSVERIFDEFMKIIREKKFDKSLNLLIRTGLLQQILPEVQAMVGVLQSVEYHPEGDVYVHTLKALEHLPENASDELLIATLLHDVGKPKTQTFGDRIRFHAHEAVGASITERILKRFKASTDFTDQVVSLVRGHMKFMAVKDMKKSTLKRFVSVGKFTEHLALHYADCLSSHGNLDNYLFLKAFIDKRDPEEFRPVKLITGEDLKALGIPTSTIYRDILLEVEDEQLEGRIYSREAALAYITKFV